MTSPGPTSLTRLRATIQSAFSLFDKNSSNTISPEDVAPLMRFLGQFPSEQILSDSIMKQLMESAHSREISYEAFEKMMLKSLLEHAYDPDDQETLLAAFRTLDADNRGYIEVETLRDSFAAGHHGLREKELNEFIEFAREGDKIWYEDYVWKLRLGVEKHLGKVYKEVRSAMAGNFNS